MYVFQQIVFGRLYKGGSNSEGGTLIQLRNLLSGRNVASDVSERSNATVDFLEFVTNCHVLAVAMNYFGMKDTSSTPTSNSLPLDINRWPPERQWKTFREVVGRIVDRYVISLLLNLQ